MKRPELFFRKVPECRTILKGDRVIVDPIFIVVTATLAWSAELTVVKNLNVIGACRWRNAGGGDSSRTFNS